MDWIGWVFAGIALVAIVAAVKAWRLLAAERAHASELLCTRIEAEDALETLRAEHEAQAPVDAARAAIAGQLDGSLAAARTQLEGAGAQLADYRRHVCQYDAAVQYCLQPVELLFGADKATLDQLVQHVEGARRKLFEARAALVQHPLHAGGGALDDGLGELHGLADYARSLAVPDAAAAPASVAS